MENTPHAPSRLRSPRRFGFARFVFSSVLIGAGLLLVLPRQSHAATTPAHTIYNMDEVQTAPAPKREVHVRFPREVRKEHGEITLRFVVTADGKVTQLTVMKFSDPEMVEPAYDAYTDADFSPGVKDGKPVDTWVLVTQVAK